ncbi:anthranilate synthase component 1 [Aliiglaciecola sp. M165]|uniref:anthranilate synthase component 1 n=1 Tax=Aliiglaciecola sp. M165 TaxID=2593649 RepID=UPI00117EFDDE|nr:anthranilate synthase component 1 [Aliiglaciecola sp. M165]TRY30349.1 anthranilate synthase component 1 [Aliiglaciecola sp. M165]
MSLTQLSEQPGLVETLVKSGKYIADPLHAYQQLCENKANTLLLESAEIDSKDNLKSLILVDAALKLICHGHSVDIIALNDNGQSVLPLFEQHVGVGVHIKQSNSNQITLLFPQPDPSLDEDARLKAAAVFDAIRIVVTKIRCLRQHPQNLFLGGAFAYDLLASFEQLPYVADSENTCPDFTFYLAQTLLVIDHKKQTTDVVSSVFSGKNVGQSYFAVSQQMEQIIGQLEKLQQTPDIEIGLTEVLQLSVDKSDEEFKLDVLNLKEHILAGDIFQVVPSRTFSLDCPAPLLAYAELKKQNPSPYMFYLQDDDFAMFGASPESALKYEASSNQVEIYPIAGTRPRGKNADGSINVDLDSRIELNLREDQKEKAEHLMLVDLARNDVAKVSKPGTRFVKDLLKVDRYSHVMHLVSRVVGQLRDDLDALHAYAACMNMGTLVGAPKVSAASLIRNVEKKRRGSYGGAVGYINGSGDMDSCIVIRSAFIRKGKAYIQAGAGVVHDSVPQAEADETRGKAQAVISAIMTAHQRPHNDKTSDRQEVSS